MEVYLGSFVSEEPFMGSRDMIISGKCKGCKCELHCIMRVY